MDAIESPALQQLEQSGFPYRLHYHSNPLRSVEQAAAERNQTPEQVIRSILFRIESEEYVLVLMPGSYRVSWPGLRAYLGVRRLTLADKAEVMDVTGYKIGTVSPLGLKQSLRMLVDRRVLDQSEISLGCGVPGVGLILAVETLLKALPDYEAGDFAE